MSKVSWVRMNFALLMRALAGAQAAAAHNDRGAFIVAVRAAQSQLSHRLDLVRALDASIASFPRSRQLQQVCESIPKQEKDTRVAERTASGHLSAQPAERRSR